ncbi:hypothetical protein PANTOEA_22025 [Pantoea dispersa]|jgi:hypothetical protein|uniref:hypothetical protein n=1 Tax=Pantoea dispersa TaxID=59814 RepID=UPI001CA74829|nr:hypothetical protein [Pantoea dispersa]QZY92981.1 hypothetical protein K7H94_22875 [Pantoea dispersa]
MNKRTRREQRIRLCALQLRYRKAWKTQASSCRLAALLTEIEVIQHRLAADSTQTEAICS